MYCAPVMSTLPIQTSENSTLPPTSTSTDGTVIQEESMLRGRDQLHSNGGHVAMAVVEEDEPINKSTATVSLNSEEVMLESKQEVSKVTEEELAGTEEVLDTSGNMESSKPVNVSSSGKVESHSVDGGSGSNLSSEEYHEHLHRLSQSSCCSNHTSSDPIDIPASSDTQKSRSVSSGNGHVSSDVPHECSDEHFALTPLAHPPAANIEMKSMKKESFTNSDHTKISGIDRCYQSPVSRGR